MNKKNTYIPLHWTGKGKYFEDGNCTKRKACYELGKYFE